MCDNSAMRIAIIVLTLAMTSACNKPETWEGSIESLLSATIYTNENQTLNDNW
jgi:hypothetical protein